MSRTCAVPAGTRMDFALDLGLHRNDVVGALDAFTNGVERRIDLATRPTGWKLVHNASLGLYAEIVQSPDYRDVKVKTAASILPELLGPNMTPLDLRCTGPDGQPQPTAQLILVSNDPYQLDYPGGRGTRARIDPGVLGIVAVMIADADDARRFAASVGGGSGSLAGSLAGPSGAHRDSRSCWVRPRCRSASTVRP